MNSLQKHYAAVAALGCIPCLNMGMGFVQPQIHHPYGRKGENERKVYGCCYSHHQSQVNNKLFVSRHPWAREFARRYGTEAELLEQVDRLLGNDK